MRSLRRVLDVAAFESRLARRLVRTWVLGILAFLLGLLTSAQYLTFHIFNGISGPYAVMTRDFWIFQAIVFTALVLGLMGVFHAFDWRHRDVKANFAATYDASALSRLELAWGKYLGLWPWLLWPLALLCLVQALGILLVTLLLAPLPVPVSVFATSVLAYGVPLAVTPMAIAFGVAAVTNSRAASIASGLAYLGATMATMFGLPEEIAVLATGYVDPPFHSIFVGYQLEAMGPWHYLANAALVALFVTLGACGKHALPRSPSDRAFRTALAGALVLLFALGLFGTWWTYRKATSDREAILAAEAAVSGSPEATVVRRELEVTVGRGTLSGRGTLTVRNDSGQPLTSIHLRLNAGLDLRSVEGPGGPVPFTRDRTVVTLALPEALAPGEEREIELAWDGGLDLPSVDADAALATAKLDARSRGTQRFFLGSTAAYLERSVVALGTDAAWYPESGVAFGHAYPARAVQQFAPGTLLVRVPAGWRAASAGRREELEDGSFRFTCDEPVPGLSLNAGPYEEVEAEVAGTRLRVLYHPTHRRNVTFFAEAAPVLKERIAERIADVKARTGLPMPPEISLVEVPQMMATFGSGWDTPNRFGAPGVVMVREAALLGARFEVPLKLAKARFKRQASGERDDREREDAARQMGVERREQEAPEDDDLTTFDAARAKANLVQRFVATDWSGGDVERLAFRSAWDHRAQAVGKEAPVTGVALSSYQAEVALGHAVVDTPEVGRVLMNNDGIGQVIGATIVAEDADVTGLVVKAMTSLDDVYALIQSTPLDQMSPGDDPALFVGVLHVKGRQPLAAIRAALGDDDWAAMTARLLAAPGRRYGWAEFRQAVLDEADPATAPALAVLLDNWLTGTSLPGFLVSDAKLQRLAGEDERWQVSARVANRGDAPGIARFDALVGKDTHSSVISVAAGEEVEVGLVLPRKPDNWKLSPFLALNRQPPAGGFEVDEDPAEAEPFAGTRPAPPTAGAPPVLVDNLDAGFTLTLEGGREVPFTVAPGEDDPLPAWNGWNKPGKWSRFRPQGMAGIRPFGLFDLTCAVKSGTEKGGHPARWRATLPAEGTYRVEAYLQPSEKFRGPRRPAKSHQFTVHAASGEEEVAIDLPAEEAGWVDLGRYRFGREAEVELDDKGEGLVFADAVRFVPEGS